MTVIRISHTGFLLAADTFVPLGPFSGGGAAIRGLLTPETVATGRADRCLCAVVRTTTRSTAWPGGRPDHPTGGSF